MNQKLDIKKVLKAVVHVVILGFGVFFIMNTASDIQFGFGILFTYLGIAGLLAI